MKKAFIVTLHIQTRVVTDVSDDFDINNMNLIDEDDYRSYQNIRYEAIQRVADDPDNYLQCVDLDFEEDTECPYGTYHDEKE